MSGLIYSTALIIVSNCFGLLPAVIAAVSAAALILVWRLCRRSGHQPAIIWFGGAVLGVAVAMVTGQSRDIFAIRIWTSLLMAAVFTVSVLVRQPRPHLVLGRWSRRCVPA